MRPSSLDFFLGAKAYVSKAIVVARKIFESG